MKGGNDMRSKQYAIAALTAVLLTGGGLSTPVLAQDGYDHQQWWNPGDWFDSNPQYNLFSDQYWNNRGDTDTRDYNDYSYNDTWDNDPYEYGYNGTWDYNPSYDYGYYDNWDYDSDYGYDYDRDDNSELGSNDAWNDNNEGVGTAGSYESGLESGSDQTD